MPSYVGHAPFWHLAAEYNHYLARFIDDVERMRV
ncbi:hypothetical protein HNR60_002819 [Rhodopseudomonas rhenobacensis]|uniref:Uncharacterized protein n=1 Tax=Rhodopseudomonas rhenobacensis TaxID=87461 RepID=A0A7W7Z560_9BRAD|nr:hypothetical protein [Rhodopseudomonas rhenobacensis]